MSKYDEYLAQAKASVKTAGEYIPKLCEELKKEGLDKESINDKVTKDCLAIGLGRSTIVHNMPQEYKDEERVEAGKKSAEKKKEMLVTTDGNVVANRQQDTAQNVKEKLESIKAPEEWIPNEGDADFLRKRLTKALDDQKALELENERLKEERTQLAEVVKKESFTKASEVEGEKVILTIDTIKVDRFKNVPVGALLPRVQAPLRNRGWKVFDVIVVDKS